METDEIISDLSQGGKYQEHYEQLLNCIGNNYSIERIKSMKNTICFDNPKMEHDLLNMHVLEVLYHYSKLE